MTTEQMIEEAKNESHLKWLSKAETAVINGSEMTVLPYGYLSQAVGEALEKIIPLIATKSAEEAMDAMY